MAITINNTTITINNPSSITINRSTGSYALSISGSLPTGYAQTADQRGILRSGGVYDGNVVVFKEKIHPGESVSAQRTVCTYYSSLGLSSYDVNINVDDVPYSLSQGNDGSNSYLRKREYGISYSGSNQEYNNCDFGDWFRIAYVGSYVLYQRSDNNVDYTTICASEVKPSGSYYVWVRMDDTSNTGFSQIIKNSW